MYPIKKGFISKATHLIITKITLTSKTTQPINKLHKMLNNHSSIKTNNKTKTINNPNQKKPIYIWKKWSPITNTPNKKYKTFSPLNNSSNNSHKSANYSPHPELNSFIKTPSNNSN